MISQNKREFVINSIKKRYQLRFNIEKTNSGDEDFVVLLDELGADGKRKPVLRFDESTHPHTSDLYKYYHVHNFMGKGKTEKIGKSLSKKQKIEKSMEYLENFIDKTLPARDASVFKSQIPGIKQQILQELNIPQYGKRTTNISITANTCISLQKKSKKGIKNETTKRMGRKRIG